MEDVKKMLRAVINGQSSLKQELLAKIDKVDKNRKEDNFKLRVEMKDGFRKVNERLDRQGKQLAVLDDDAPTSEEFGNLVKRVDKLEIQIASN